MPGLVGLISGRRDRVALEESAQTMIGCAQHETFYRSGIYTAPELGCAVGWVNHPNSYSDCNPILSASGDVALVFTGEHFGGRPNANATELLGLYEKRGEAFLRELNGWFSGVLIDLRKRRVAVFNDRYGMGRLYWTQHDDEFAFASEAKSLLALYPERQLFDLRSVAEFLTFGSVSRDRTLFSGVSLIPGAALWTFDNSSSPRPHTYFDIREWEAQPPATGEQYYEALKHTLSSIVPNYCEGNPSVGISLTGGLDTRLIMAARPGDLANPCYTYGGMYRDCFDVEAAAQVASISGQAYRVIPLEHDFFSNFEQLAERTIWLSDGTLDICGAHELYFSARAREISPFRLTGNYGSEALRSISTYKHSSEITRFFTPDLQPHAEQAQNDHSELKRAHPVTHAVKHEMPWHLYGRLSVAQSQLQVRSPYMDNELVALVYRAPPALRTGNTLSLRLISELNPRLGELETDMGLSLNSARGDMRSRPRRLLRYLLFKAEWYYNFGMPRAVAGYDSVLLRPLERFFLGTHKIDHYRVWFRDQLHSYVADLLSQPDIDDLPFVVRQPGAKHLRSISGQDALDISRLITLHLVRKQLFRGISDSARKIARQVPMQTATLVNDPSARP